MHESGSSSFRLLNGLVSRMRVAGGQKNGLPPSRTAARSCSLFDTCSNSSYCICPEKKNAANPETGLRRRPKNMRFRCRLRPEPREVPLYRARIAVGSSVQMRSGANSSAISRASGVLHGQTTTRQPRALPSATIARSAVGMWASTCVHPSSIERSRNSRVSQSPIHPCRIEGRMDWTSSTATGSNDVMVTCRERLTLLDGGNDRRDDAREPVGRVAFDLDDEIWNRGDRVQHLIERRHETVFGPIGEDRAGIELVDVGQGQFGHLAGAVRRTVHRVVVNDDEVLIGGQANVEFECVQTDLDRVSKTREGVFRRFESSAPVSDEDRVGCQAILPF